MKMNLSLKIKDSLCCGLMERHQLCRDHSAIDNGLYPTRDILAQYLLTCQINRYNGEIIPMTERTKFQLEIYKLVMNQNAAARRSIFNSFGTDELKLELLKFTSSQVALNSRISIALIEAVRKMLKDIEPDIHYRSINMARPTKYPERTPNRHTKLLLGYTVQSLLISSKSVESAINKWKADYPRVSGPQKGKVNRWCRS